ARDPTRGTRGGPYGDITFAPCARYARSHMLDLADLLERAAGAAARAWLADALAAVRDDPSRVPLLLPQLPRRIGRELLPGGRRHDGTATIDTGAWRACDAAALSLLTARGRPDDALLIALHDRGDLEERT